MLIFTFVLYAVSAVGFLWRAFTGADVEDLVFWGVLVLLNQNWMHHELQTRSSTN